jgi:hypothetical protein
MLVDKWGRRTSTILGGLLLCSCMTLIGSLYASDSVHANAGLGRWVVIVTIYVFAVTYCVSKCKLSPNLTKITRQLMMRISMGTRRQTLRQ